MSSSLVAALGRFIHVMLVLRETNQARLVQLIEAAQIAVEARVIVIDQKQVEVV